MSSPSRLRALTGMICAKLTAGQRVDQRQQLVLGDQIDLGQHQKHRAIELANQPEEKFVLAGPVGALVLGVSSFGCGDARSPTLGSGISAAVPTASGTGSAQLRLPLPTAPAASRPSAPAPGRASPAPRRPPATCGGRAASPACARRAYRQRRSAPPDARPFRAGTSTTPAMRLRVVCGLAETMATFSPMRAFSSVLLPALGRPRMATNPDFKGEMLLTSLRHFRLFGLSF